MCTPKYSEILQNLAKFLTEEEIWNNPQKVCFIQLSIIIIVLGIYDNF